jgi:protein Mpv17
MLNLFRFTVLNMLITPPNYLFGRLLEDLYPTKPISAVHAKGGPSALSLTNTFIQFLLHQSIGSWGNTLAFIVIMGSLRGDNFESIVQTIQHDGWSMVKAGWAFWPMVCLLNLLVIPFNRRMLVVKLAAFIWGVFISLTT